MGAYYLGIDLGGTHIAAALVDDTGVMSEKRDIPTGASRGAEAVIADLLALGETVCARAGVRVTELRGVGVGCPGVCDGRAGRVLFADNLGWRDTALADRVREVFPVPCRIANDASCAALGETLFGAARGLSDVVLLTLGTGLGGGIVLDGALREGYRSLGGELGHITLRQDGEPCVCGRRGCAEAYVSATALIRQARRAAEKDAATALRTVCGGDLTRLDARMVFLAAGTGDETACRVLDRYLTDLGEVLVNITNLLRPQALLLGGGVAAGCAAHLNRLNAFVREHAYGGELIFIPPVRLAALGGDAGIIGAAALVM